MQKASSWGSNSEDKAGEQSMMWTSKTSSTTTLCSDTHNLLHNTSGLPHELISLCLKAPDPGSHGASSLRAMLQHCCTSSKDGTLVISPTMELNTLTWSLQLQSWFPHLNLSSRIKQITTQLTMDISPVPSGLALKPSNKEWSDLVSNCKPSFTNDSDDLS